MAHTALLLRRALSLTPQLLSYTRLTLPTTTTTTAAATTTLLHHNTNTTTTLTHHRSFHSSRRLSLSANRSFNDTDKIDPDTILFEGCDYNHFLIVMDFGKDPSQRPPPEHMVETYVQTAAKVLGSVEEAKKRIYACSTTTYTGFQVEVDEATSNKFEGLPGVIFVLPDSYIDPANKEYGGDKYDNGIIIPRPPPVQYGRTNRGVRMTERETRESMHRNPVYNQQRNPVYNQQATPVYNQQATPVYNQHATPVYNQHGSLPPPPPPPGPLQYGRGYPPPPPPPPGPLQGFSQQQRFPIEQNFRPQPNNVLSGQASGTHPPVVARDVHQGGVTNFVPPVQGNYNHGYNHSQGQMNNPSGNYGGYTPPGPHQSNPVDYAYNNAQGQMGFSGDSRSSFPSPVTGAYGQTGAGTVEQNGAGQYGQGPTGYTPDGQNQSFPQTSNVQSSPTGHGSYPPGPQTGFNQGRY